MAPTSGIKITDDVKNTYLRVFKKPNKLPYAIFMFNKDFTEVVVDYNEQFYEKQYTHDQLLGLMPKDSPRFFAFDFPYISANGMKKSTILLFSWFPQDCSTKARFVVGTTFLSLAETLNVNKSRYMEGEELTDIDEAAILANNKEWSRCPVDQLDLLEGPVPIVLSEKEKPEKGSA